MHLAKPWMVSVRNADACGLEGSAPNGATRVVHLGPGDITNVECIYIAVLGSDKTRVNLYGIDER